MTKVYSEMKKGYEVMVFEQSPFADRGMLEVLIIDRYGNSHRLAQTDTVDEAKTLADVVITEYEEYLKVNLKEYPLKR